MPSDPIVILCTAPDDATADRIAQALVVERLAACANVLPGLRSHYRWQGKVEQAAEVLLLVKTERARFDAVSARVRALHPYELPELIALPIAAGSPDYLAWLTENSTP